MGLHPNDLDLLIKELTRPLFWSHDKISQDSPNSTSQTVNTSFHRPKNLNQLHHSTPCEGPEPFLYHGNFVE